ncbi:hypothetical protein HID58_060677 [Brassica napus]|uniref:Uncharacterized protein n=1 Tax=Brassica napus TaxID=3708 RepID=A0ABQ7ZWC9_BRANA|nr:hypothetical protein HID58_060677 [Brassica napus]
MLLYLRDSRVSERRELKVVMRSELRGLWIGDSLRCNVHDTPDIQRVFLFSERIRFLSITLHHKRKHES